MSDALVFIPDVRRHHPQEPESILSRTLQSDERSRIILFSFAAGQELTAHSAPCPATLYFAQGHATVQLGGLREEVSDGAFVYMPANLEHAIHAHTPVTMILTMLRQAPAAA